MNSGADGSRPTKIMIALGSGVATLSVIVLLGWLTNNLVIAAVISGSVAMQPITAVCALISALGVIALAFGERKILVCTSLLILAVCCVTILEYARGVTLAFDLALFSKQVLSQTGYDHPGRMAPVTAAIFTLLSISSFARATNLKGALGTYIAVATGGFAFITLLGHFFGVAAFNAVISNLHVAFPTALTFLMLSLGLLMAPPQPLSIHLLLSRSVGGEIARRIVPVVIIVPITFCWLALKGSDFGFFPANFRLVLISFGSVTLMVSLTLWAAVHVNQITQRHSEEQRRLIDQLRKADAEAQAATLAKSQFLASMSHEIRTPLNGVIGMAQAISLGSLEPEQRIRLEVLKDSSGSLLSILNDILDLTKVEAGKIELESVEFGLFRLLNSTFSTFQTIASEKELEFVIDAQGVSGTYLGDPTRVRQIITNLVSNALKFTKSGSISIRGAFVSSGVQIMVCDTGPGIAADFLPTLFSRFTQADVSTTRNFGGTGLGLAICRELVLLMNGDLSVSSEVGVGTTFTLTLPISRLGNEQIEIQGGGQELGEFSAGRSLRILAADDNSTNRLVLETLLGQVGVSLTLVEDGAQALESWRSGSWDLILMDVHMPVKDGVTATREIRQQERARNIRATPIIALTANVMTEQVEGYISAGMNGYVPKPIDLSKLLAEMDRVLSEVDPDEGLGIISTAA